MRKTSLSFLLAALAAISAFAQNQADSLVLVKGGPFKNTKSNYYGKMVTVSDFYIGKYEVTQKEWAEVMGTNPSEFKGDDLPVENVSWYDCVEYCNQRSVKEGFAPYYNIDKERKDPANENDGDAVKWVVTANRDANGYRLPTEAEWEYAAGGGQLSKSYLYSGGDDVSKVAWTWRDAGDKVQTGYWSWRVVKGNHTRTKPVGGKEPNELGLFDMSGNVREWCWDWSGDLEVRGSDPLGAKTGSARVWRGGGWVGDVFCCEVTFRGGFEPNGKGSDQGLRLCRSKTP